MNEATTNDWNEVGGGAIGAGKPVTKKAPAVTPQLGDEIEIRVDEYDPRVHIGQFEHNTFVWAQEPEKVLRVCVERLDDALFVDDRGRTETGGDSLHWVRETPWDTDLVGQRFS